MVRYGAHPARAVYDSLAEPWIALAPGWLNLGLWEGPGDESEAPDAVRRLVSTLAAHLPEDASVLDVGNGLGAQDAVIAEVARPRRLVALNVTESQLRAGRARLRAAGALPVVGDATRLPLAGGVVDGLISVEAAFHFSSRARFFSEARRVLRPGGVLAMSDVSVERLPRTPAEAAAGAFNLRFWGLRARALASAERIRGLAEEAGLRAVSVVRCGDRVLAPAVRVLRRRATFATEAPTGQRAVALGMLAGWDLLYRRAVIDYLLVTARAP
jgi:SAM-dependent methyltransferase